MAVRVRSAAARGLFALTASLACIGMPSCSPAAPQYPYQGKLLDAGTGLPAADIDILVDTMRAGEFDQGVVLEGQGLQDALERLLNEPDPRYYFESPVVRSDAAGEFAYHVTVFNYLGEQATGISGCTSPLRPPVVVEQVWVYAKINGVWRQLEVPLTEADQSEIVPTEYRADGVRRIVLPTVYVTAAGLSLTPGQE